MSTKTTAAVHPLLEGTTPGPWILESVIYDNYTTHPVRAPFYIEAVHWHKPKAGHTRHERDQQNANAKLIAAAPTLATENAKLRAALEALLSRCSADIITRYCWINEQNTAREVLASLTT